MALLVNNRAHLPSRWLCQKYGKFKSRGPVRLNSSEAICGLNLWFCSATVMADHSVCKRNLSRPAAASIGYQVGVLPDHSTSFLPPVISLFAINFGSQCGFPPELSEGASTVKQHFLMWEEGAYFCAYLKIWDQKKPKQTAEQTPLYRRTLRISSFAFWLLSISGTLVTRAERRNVFVRNKLGN